MSEAKKNLLMITYPFPPNSSAGAMRSERFARYLPQFGWAVEVVTIKSRRDMFKDTELLAKLGDYVRVHLTRTLDPWLWLKDKNPRNFLLKKARSVLMRLFSFPDHMLLWVPFVIRKSLGICKNKQVDAIYTTSPPHSTHLVGLILSRFTGKPWIADFRDPWTLNAYREKGIIERFLLRLEKMMEQMVLKNASFILANTRANQRNLLKAFPFLDEKKVIHLPNGWEEFPAECYQGEKKGGLLTIVHAGNFYPKFKPYGLLYALAAWRNGEKPTGIPPLKNGDIKVILLGARDEETAEIIKQLNISDLVEIHPWVALDEARRIMCRADLLWASLGTGKESSTYIPSKLFEYLAARRPIIGFFPEGEAESFIRETGTGVVFSKNEAGPVLIFLHEMAASNRAEANQSCYHPVKEVIDAYNIASISSKLAGLLDKISTHQ
jgi:glycosyltransferase involved in cell wall biosynthesis